MSIYHRVFGAGRLQFITTSTYRRARLCFDPGWQFTGLSWLRIAAPPASLRPAFSAHAGPSFSELLIALRIILKPRASGCRREPSVDVFDRYSHLLGVGQTPFKPR
jgi:hypothetical protein